MIVKDSIVLIHLAKTSVLKECCNYFGDVFIPTKVKEEVIKNKYPEERVILNLIASKKIKVKEVTKLNLIKKANDFNIQKGEAEAVALYWELKAEYLATDDDNVRKKKDILNLNLIGTPAIILKLYKNKEIDINKLKQVIAIMRKVGWFGNTIWDKILIVAEK